MFFPVSLLMESEDFINLIFPLSRIHLPSAAMHATKPVIGVNGVTADQVTDGFSDSHEWWKQKNKTVHFHRRRCCRFSSPCRVLIRPGWRCLSDSLLIAIVVRQFGRLIRIFVRRLLLHIPPPASRAANGGCFCKYFHFTYLRVRLGTHRADAAHRLRSDPSRTTCHNPGIN